MGDVKRSALYFTEAGDHFGEYMHTAVSDDLVLCDESFEEEFEEARDKTGCRGIVIVVVVVIVVPLLLLRILG